MAEALHIGLGILLVFAGLAMLVDWKSGASRVLKLQHAFLSDLSGMHTEEEDFVSRMMILGRTFGLFILTGGVYTLVLAIAVWPRHRG